MTGGAKILTGGPGPPGPRLVTGLGILVQWRCKSIRVSTYNLKLFYPFLIISLLKAHISWQLNLDQNVQKKN